jgi:hypothetical protein
MDLQVRKTRHEGGLRSFTMIAQGCRRVNKTTCTLELRTSKDFHFVHMIALDKIPIFDQDLLVCDRCFPSLSLMRKAGMVFAAPNTPSHFPLQFHHPPNSTLKRPQHVELIRNALSYALADASAASFSLSLSLPLGPQTATGVPCPTPSTQLSASSFLILQPARFTKLNYDGIQTWAPRVVIVAGLPGGWEIYQNTFLYRM